MRSMAAIARQMEREAEKKRKQDYKEAVAANAAQDVDDWKSYIAELVSIHTRLTEPMDWQSILEKPEPSKPVRSSAKERKAREALEGFRPRLRDKVLGRTARRKSELEHKLSVAPDLDDRKFEEEQHRYEEALAEWKEDRALAERLAAGEGAAIRQVIEEMQPLVKEDRIGSAINFEIADNYLHAKPMVHGDEIVPDFRRKQLASGKLSQTKMPKGEFNELYQDYVASVALKVAGDLFHVLPLDTVYVTCEAEMLNTATGHLEPAPILSVQFVRPTMDKLNLASVDPSDSMTNFNHRMSWSKTKGFQAVESLGANTVSARLP